MKQIPLSGKCGIGKVTLISDEDYKSVSGFLWYMDSKGYPYREKCKEKRVFLHQFIMGVYPKGKTEIDHINGKKLDNRRSNLRFCTNAENRLNRTKYKTNTSGYRGVMYHKIAKKYMARVYINNKTHYLGLFKTKEEANKAVEETKGKQEIIK